MKVAYCLSGFLRCYQENKFIENMVAKVPGDVFIHTWDELTPGTPLNVHEAYKFYDPLGIIVENQKDIEATIAGVEDKSLVPADRTKIWTAVGCEKCNKTG